MHEGYLLVKCNAISGNTSYMYASTVNSEGQAEYCMSPDYLVYQDSSGYASEVRKHEPTRAV